MTRQGLDVAVVGGGAFGAKAAIDLARSGHRVDLFERREDLMLAASGINQYRLHRGYHYPRSLATAIECRDSELTFRKAFANAVVDSAEHFYAVAAHDSRTSADAYLRFCDRAGLEYRRSDLDLLRPGSVDLVVRVCESIFDPAVLRLLLRKQLQQAGVKVRLGMEATRKVLSPYELVIVAAYSEINSLGAVGPVPEMYQFEVCEKPVVRLPAQYARRSVVVMDGPFMCVDPLAGTDLFVLGNVVHAIHHANVGTSPEIPGSFRRLLNRGIVTSPAVTNIDEFIRSGSEFFVDFDKAEHVGSMFTVRAVLPGVHRTDARPTIIRRATDRLITVFSGKIDTCVRSAQQITHMADEMAYGRPANDPEEPLRRRRAG
ncbi:MAG: FAD-dependent oxidoreductase [Chloroflexi bacterium]|nr:FAD-dependent oxidoreductase [Actinomycetota bacterium]MBA3739625.1 FAD-dependent oxidoreductase [Chloroflexota bacterium]